MTSVVVGAIDGYNWKQIETWYKSLRLTGYQGQVIMIVSECDEETKNILGSYGIHIFMHMKKHPQIVVSRFQAYSELAANFPEDTWMICTDVGDIVFQYNPDDFLNSVPVWKSIVVASEGILFKGNYWVRENLRQSFPQFYNKMINKPLYNAGSFAAKAEVLVTLANNVFMTCMTNETARNHDQASLNIWLREGPYNQLTLFTLANDIWCYCAASSMFAKPTDAANYMELLPVIRDNQCYVSGERLTCMFHHYNRSPKLAKEIINMINYKWHRAEKDQTLQVGKM